MWQTKAVRGVILVLVFILCLPATPALAQYSIIWTIEGTVGGAAFRDIKGIAYPAGSTGFESAIGNVIASISGGEFTLGVNYKIPGTETLCFMTGGGPLGYGGGLRNRSGNLSSASQDCSAVFGNFTASGADSEGDFYVASSNGPYEIRHKGQLLDTAITTYLLTDGDSIQTIGPTIVRVVNRRDSSITTIAPNTQFTLNRSTGHATLFDLLFGWLRAGALRIVIGDQERCTPNPCKRTETPNTGIGVRGTSYDVEVSTTGGTTSTRVLVNSNSVDVSSKLTGVTTTLTAGNSQTVTDEATLLAAVLPYARSVNIGTPATAFATILNTGTSAAVDCAPSLPIATQAYFQYQTTNSANQPVGTVNSPATIAAGGAQSFVIAATPAATLAGAELEIGFKCASTISAPVTYGVNTFILSASSGPSPDVIAIGSTLTNDGIVSIAGSGGVSAFSAAGINIGSAATLTARADDGVRGLPLEITICQTIADGTCIAPPAANVATSFGAAQTATFSIFVRSSGAVAFDPGANRLFLRFVDQSGVTRGATSVAVRTTSP